MKRLWKGASRPRDGALLLRRAFTLLVVLAFTLVGLALVNLATSGAVARWERQREWEAMSRVMPEANIFSEIHYQDERADDIQAAYRDSTLLGYCVTVTTRGFFHPVTSLVGVDNSGVVTGVLVLEEDESDQLGDGIRSEAFLSQFIGRSGTITVGGGRNAVDGVSQATVSSQAVAEGVSLALGVVADLDLTEWEGGSGDEV